jgi:hypothetical protein
MAWRRSEDESEVAFAHEFGKARLDVSQAIEYLDVGEHAGYLEHRGLGFGAQADVEASSHEKSMDTSTEQLITACVAEASQTRSVPSPGPRRHHKQRGLHHVLRDSVSESEKGIEQAEEVLCAPLSGCHNTGTNRAARTSMARTIVCAKRAARAAQRPFDPVAVRDKLLAMAEDPKQLSAHSVLCCDSGAAAWVQNAASMCGLSSGRSGRVRTILITVNRTCQARRLSSSARTQLDSWLSQAVESLLQHGRVMAGVAQQPDSQPKRAGLKRRPPGLPEVNFVFSGVLTDPASMLLDQAPRLSDSAGEPASVRVSLQEVGDRVMCKLSLIMHNLEDDAQDCAVHSPAECSVQGADFMLSVACRRRRPGECSR